MKLEDLVKDGIPAWFTEGCMVGIDEAGRGPVLGPMVYSVAFCSLETGKTLSKRSYADSKQLKEDKRETLYKEMEGADDLGFCIDSLSATDISRQMLAREKVSLNTIANDSTYGLIQKLIDAGVKVQEVYVDTVGNAATYEAKLSQRFPGIKFTVAPKADSLYPIVSAASIVAKVSRDRSVRDFQFEEQGAVAAAFTREFGSGYPSDPATKAWLEKNMDPLFGFPSLVRFSWSTCETILDNKGVKVTWECDADEEEGAGQMKLQMPGAAPVVAKGPKGKNPQKRHSFFRTRGMALVTDSVLGGSRGGASVGQKRARDDDYEDDEYI